MKNDSAAKIEIIRNGELPSAKGPDDYFTGNVRVDAMLPGKHSSQISAALVTFEPGSRTAWHTHPLGQLLFIMTGVGQVQQEGGEIIDVCPGDTVWFPAHLKHWHGASLDKAMSHISIVVEDDGKNADWMEKVTGRPYGK